MQLIHEKGSEINIYSLVYAHIQYAKTYRLKIPVFNTLINLKILNALRLLLLLKVHTPFDQSVTKKEDWLQISDTVWVPR